MSLVALGGYGRRELSPHSDLDLLLTFPKKLPAGLADRVWYPIWDSGVKLAHSVRTVDDTLKLAKEDLDTATSLVDARVVLGDPDVAEDLAGRAVVQWRRRGNRWLSALAASTADRHARFDDIAFAIEPDLKHGGGGLRDAQSLRWAELAGASAPRGMSDLRSSVDTLTHVRNHLHLATPRATDHLRVDLLDEVATRAGYGSRDTLMAAIAGAARPVGWAANELFYDIASPGKRVRFATGRGTPDMVAT